MGINKRQRHATLAFLKFDTKFWDPPPPHPPPHPPSRPPSQITTETQIGSGAIRQMVPLSGGGGSW